jgi:hypothetical protein
MKKGIITIFLFFVIGTNLLSQNPPLSRYDTLRIKETVLDEWLFFRLLKDSANNITSRNSPSGYPINVYSRYLGKKYRNYFPVIKITKWPREQDFYLVEKGDGMKLEDWNSWREIIDSTQIHIHDSIFPYDDRILIVRTADDRVLTLSGNVEWMKWNPTSLPINIHRIGPVRGVQFGVDDVFDNFDKVYSDKVKRFRPEYPDYEYIGAGKSFLSTRGLIMGASKGDAGNYMELIFYTNNDKMTGDTVRTHFYEMRYILPREIKSIKERHLEKRLLTDEELARFRQQEFAFLYIQVLEDVRKKPEDYF